MYVIITLQTTDCPSNTYACLLTAYQLVCTMLLYIYISHRRAGVSSLACIPPTPLVPSGGLIEVTADPIPQLRVLSGAPMSGQLITPGCAGGSTGGGQGHFAVQKLIAGVYIDT
jgi:hypothetical protein